MPPSRDRPPRRGWRMSLAVSLLLLVGCTRVVDDARPQMEPPVGPIAANQVDDLVSKNVQPDDDGDPFATVEPEECAAAAREVKAPFIFAKDPVAHSGGGWDDPGPPPGGVLEIVGVYHSDYDPRAAADEARRVIESCRDEMLKVTTSDGAVLDFSVTPQPDSGSPEIVLWSLTDVGGWACDNAFVTAYNAAIELTVCAETNGYDVSTLARDALKRIEQLVNTTA